MEHKLFGNKLREARKKQRLTTYLLAKACGVSRSYITLIENGKRSPGKKIIPKLAAALSLDTSVVLGWYLEDISCKMQKIIESS